MASQCNMFGFNRSSLAQAHENLVQALRALSLAQQSEQVTLLIIRVKALSCGVTPLDPESVNEALKQSEQLPLDPSGSLVPDPILIARAELRNALRYSTQQKP